MRRIIMVRFAIACLVVLWNLSYFSIFATSRLASSTVSPGTNTMSGSPAVTATPTGASAQDGMALSTPTISVSPSLVPPPAMPDPRLSPPHVNRTGQKVNAASQYSPVMMKLDK